MDETGLIGIHHETEYGNMTTETTALCGVAIYAELIDRVVVGSITAGGAAEPAALSAPAYDPGKAVEDMTVTELRAYAADNGIDLKGLTVKADILAAIQAAEDEGGPAEDEAA